MKVKTKAIAAIMVTMLLVGVTFYVLPVKAQQYLKIGIIGPYGAIQGEGMFEGAELAMNWINGPGGGIVIGGTRYDVSLHFGDEHSVDQDPEAGAAEALRLITAEQVDLVIGGFRTECTHPIREVAADYKTPYFICGAATNELIDCGTGTCGACVRCNYARYKYTFRVTFNQTTLLKNLVGFLAGYALPYRLVPLYGDPVNTAVIAEDLPWTVGLYNAIVYGGALGPHANIVYAARTSKHTTNFTPYLDAMHAAEVRLIVHLFSTPSSIAFISQWAVHPIKAVPVGIDAFGQCSEFWPLTGGACQYETILASTGTRTPVSTVSEPYTTVEFWDLYYATYGHAPIFTSFGAYEAIIAMHDMLEAQTAVTPPFTDAEKDTFVSQAEATDRESTLGRFKYTQYHDPFSNEFLSTWTQHYVRPFVVQWQAGRLEVVWPMDQPYSKIWALPDETGKMYPYPADVNQDGEVDNEDVLIVQDAYHSSPGDPSWQFAADIVRDNFIDVYDALAVRNNLRCWVDLPLPYCDEAGHLLTRIDVTFGSTPTVDGIISSGEYDDANSVTFATSGGTCTVYYKHDGNTLYVALDVPNLDADSAVQVFVDTDYDTATAPQPDDYRFTIARRPPPNEYGENQGTGTGWTAWGPPVGWTGAHQDLASTWNAEFSIPYAKLGITAGVAKTIGIMFYNAWTSTGDYRWPTHGDWMDPSTWRTASSSDNWRYEVTIQAYCYTEGTPVSVSITMDGSPTGYNTPHTFTGLAGTHTFTVPGMDANGHFFKQWNTGSTSTTITVNSGGTYTAYYQAKHTLTITTSAGGTTTPLPGTYTYWEGTSVSVTANPFSGYTLGYWKLDGLCTTIQSLSTTVLMDRDHTLHAVFIIRPNPPVIRVGVIGPVGLPQFDGMVEGATLAADWINGPGGGIVIGGTRYDVSLHLADEHAFPLDPPAGAAEMWRLIAAEQVDFVVGGFRTECTYPMREVAMDYQKLFFICGASTNELVDCGTGTCGACVRCNYARYKYTFRVTFNQTTLLKNLLGFLAGYALPSRLVPLYGQQLDADPQLDIKTAVIAENLVWADTLFNALVYGGYLPPQANIVYTARPPYDETNFIPYLDAMHAAEVRLIVHLFSESSNVAFISQMATHPIKAVACGIDILGQETSFWSLTGGNWDPPYGSGYATGGCQYETLLATTGTRSPISTTSQPYTTVQVWDQYLATFGRTPIYTSWNVYDTIIAMHDMLEAQTGPTYITPPFDTADANALVPIIEATNRESVLGRFKYTQHHDPFSNEFLSTWTQHYVRPFVVQWQAGRLEVVWPMDQPYSKLWALPDESGKMYPYPSDVDQNAVVNVMDALTIRGAFGSYPAQPNQAAHPTWQFVADIQRNNVIDIFDALSVRADYGKIVGPLPLAYCDEAGKLHYP